MAKAPTRKRRTNAATAHPVFSTRMDRDRRDKLAAAAEKRGFSLSSEIAARLRASFNNDDNERADRWMHDRFGRGDRYALAWIFDQLVSLSEGMPPLQVHWSHSKFQTQFIVAGIQQVLLYFQNSDEIKPPPGLLDIPPESQAAGFANNLLLHIDGGAAALAHSSRRGAVQLNDPYLMRSKMMSEICKLLLASPARARMESAEAEDEAELKRQGDALDRKES